jgi:hypothetical protein
MEADDQDLFLGVRFLCKTLAHDMLEKEEMSHRLKTHNSSRSWFFVTADPRE